MSSCAFAGARTGPLPPGFYRITVTLGDELASRAQRASSADPGVQSGNPGGRHPGGAPRRLPAAGLLRRQGAALRRSGHVGVTGRRRASVQRYRPGRHRQLLAFPWPMHGRNADASPGPRLMSRGGDPLLVYPLPDSYRDALQAMVTRCEREAARARPADAGVDQPSDAGVATLVAGSTAWSPLAGPARRTQPQPALAADALPLARCVDSLGRAAGADRLVAAGARQFHPAAGVPDTGLAGAAVTVEAGLQTALRRGGLKPTYEGYGSAKTTTCVVELGFSSGVRRRVDVASPEGPVATATYCLPSTANVIG